jgi:LPPG:FO 2-phospho-L-lactate transferase
VTDVSTIALTGGIGGAKLALGLTRAVPGSSLACVVNTGDDFEHLGLAISPDIDTLLYTLAGVANPELGWGRQGETWSFMRALEQIGGPTWFRLGDGDLALHVERTRQLRAGASLTTVTAGFAQSLGLGTLVLPMSDDPVRTRLETEIGWLDFQDYFVRLRTAPRVRRIEYSGASTARPTVALQAVLTSPALRAVVVCPSNSWLSIDPILAIPGLVAALRATGTPIVAVSPLIGGEAVKGPTAKLMRELGLETTPGAIAEHYRDLIDGLVIDESDRGWADRCGVPTLVTPTLMRDIADRVRLAEVTLQFAMSLGPRTRKVGSG